MSGSEGAGGQQWPPATRPADAGRMLASRASTALQQPALLSLCVVPHLPLILGDPLFGRQVIVEINRSVDQLPLGPRRFQADVSTHLDWGRLQTGKRSET